MLDTMKPFPKTDQEINSYIVIYGKHNHKSDLEQLANTWFMLTKLRSEKL